MRYLDFTIRGKTIECCQDQIIADNTDYSARLHFASGWSGCTERKLLIIDDDGKLYEVALAANATEAKIPKFTTPGRIIVGVSAKLDGGQISTNAVAITVRASVRTAASDAIAAPESGADDLLTEYRKKYDALLAGIKSSDAVRYVEQELSEAEKAQARKNIGAGTGTGEVTATAIETALGYKPVNAFYVTVTPASSGDQTTGTADKTDAEIYAAYAAGSAVFCNVASAGHYSGMTATLPLFAAYNQGDDYMFAFCGSGVPRTSTAQDPPGAVTVTKNNHGWYVFYDALAKKTDIPTALKNPNALTLKLGGTTVVYDGSAAKTFEIPDGTEVSY